MSEDIRRRVLGRGLSALFGEETGDNVTELPRATRTVPVEQLHPGRFQPRHRFDAEAMAALIDSVKAQGILQPLLVRRHPDIAGTYEIVAGERRWRAAQGAGLHEVPVLVRELADREALEIALVENVQRQDLSPLEEAEGYQRLIGEFGHTQEVLAQALGKSCSHITNMLRLLALPEAVRQLVQDGKLSAGHARALVNAADPLAIAEEVTRRGLSVRETERLAQGQRPRKPGTPLPPAKDADTLALERELTALLGLKVTISFAPKPGAGGTLAVQYQTLDQLDDILRRLSNVPGPRPG